MNAYQVIFYLVTDHTSGRVQQQAVATLLDVAISGSGGAGCARAGVDDIDTLLSALQNPSQVVRDSGLRVSSGEISVRNSTVNSFGLSHY